MSDGLTRMPGHRTVPTSEVRETSLVTDIMPFLPDGYEAAMPLYISMALLFIVVSRAARRKPKTRLRPKRPKATPVQQQGTPAQQPVQVVGVARHMRRNDGYWGNG